MKKLTLLSLSLAISLMTFAQNQPHWCGMEHDAVYEGFYQNLPSNAFEPSSSRAATTYVPVYYHLIGPSTRAGIVRLSDVLQSHCDLNKAYENSDIQFYIVGIDSIFNSSFYEFANSSVGDNIMRTYNVSNVCNIYVNNDPRGVCGYAFFPGSGPSGGGIFVNKNCYGPTTSTLIHEMGHYCGLFHTFESFLGTEFVDGTNCASAGDRFCDTPADFLDYRWSCPYTGNQTDPKGALYRTVLDGSFYMSYSNDGCQDKFSAAQKTYMYNTLRNQRSALVNNGFTGFVNFDTTSLVSPEAGNTATSPNHATFIWNSVPGAQYYLFQIPSPNPSIIFADTVVRDTFVTITNLIANRNYLYRVQAFSYLASCNSFTASRPFKTASARVTAKVIQTCQNENKGSIKINVTNITAPYTVQWTSGQTDDSISGLAPGMYTVIVNGAGGEIVTADIILSNPIPMQATLFKQSNKINANVFAGEGPYTYEWSDGSTASSSNGTTGSYSVTVTDKRGCTQVFYYYPAGISGIDDSKIHVVLYPNPTQGKMTTLEVSLEKSSNTSVLVTDLKGALVLRINEDMKSGQNKLNLNLAGLNSGVYLVSATSQEGAWKGKLVVE
jgi:hypothetical protein